MQAVEDEWERNLIADEDLDVLFVAFDPQQVTVDKLLETVREHEFEATVTDEEP